MEDFDETLYVVWRSQPECARWIVGGRREDCAHDEFFAVVYETDPGRKARFQRGVHPRRGKNGHPASPPRWMDDRHEDAIFRPRPSAPSTRNCAVAVFRGKPTLRRNGRCLRGPEPLLSQTEATRRIADLALQQTRERSAGSGFPAQPRPAVTDCAAWSGNCRWSSSTVINARADDMGASGKLDGSVRADLCQGVSNRSRNIGRCCFSTSKNSPTLMTSLDELRFVTCYACSLIVGIGRIGRLGCSGLGRRSPDMATGSLAGKLSSSASSEGSLHVFLHVEGLAGFGTFDFRHG